MPKQKIVLIGYDEDGEIYRLDYEPGDEPIIDKNPSPTLEEIADFCDNNAEARNNHEFLGTHRLLAVMLYKRFGREIATEVMFEIAEYGGLDGASGLWWPNGTSAFADFGITEPWEEWAITGIEKE